jgi:hypothetical protein
MLKNDQMVSGSDDGNAPPPPSTDLTKPHPDAMKAHDPVYSHESVDRRSLDSFDWNDDTDETSYYSFPHPEDSLDEVEPQSQHEDFPRKPSNPVTIDPEEYRLRAVFDPYIKMYKKIEIYWKNGARYSQRATDVEIINSTDMFYENRMLTIRLCEEQMHLIQRHQDSRKDYHQSLAWEFMFDMFLYQRQLLAELILPPE